MTNCQNINFPHGYFQYFFFHKYTIISQKTFKIRHYLPKYKFSPRIFLNVLFFFHINTLLFLHKMAKFALTVKILTLITIF